MGFTKDSYQKVSASLVMLRDFNEIVSTAEKMSGARRPQRQMDDFREAINCCRFKDLRFCGPEFTWCNMQEGRHRMYLRLDRALVTQEWIDHYKDMRVHHLVDSTSDHCALLITDSIASQSPRKKRFQFEAMWTRKDECRDIIKAAWNESVELHNPNGMVSMGYQSGIGQFLALFQGRFRLRGKP